MRLFVSGDPFQKQEFPEPNLCREDAWNETLCEVPMPHLKLSGAFKTIKSIMVTDFLKVN